MLARETIIAAARTALRRVLTDENGNLTSAIGEAAAGPDHVVRAQRLNRLVNWYEIVRIADGRVIAADRKPRSIANTFIQQKGEAR